MKTIIPIAALLVAAMPAVASTPAKHPALPTGKVETLHISAINLDDEDGTTFTLKDAKGEKLDPIKVPLTICPKDQLGRLLPGLDVDLAVESKTETDGRIVRFVRPERFRAWCE